MFMPLCDLATIVPVVVEVVDLYSVSPASSDLSLMFLRSLRLFKLVALLRGFKDSGLSTYVSPIKMHLFRLVILIVTIMVFGAGVVYASEVGYILASELFKARQSYCSTSYGTGLLHLLEYQD
jgi:hypothetical protein